MKPMLKPLGTRRLELKHDGLLPNFAFKFNLRRYTMGAAVGTAREIVRGEGVQGRGLHSSTFQLNLSRF